MQVWVIWLRLELIWPRIGVFFLFAASILLLMVTISAPVVHDLGLLRVTLTNQTQIRHSSVSFGTFGYCILDVPPDKYGSAFAMIADVDTDDAFKYRPGLLH